MRDAILGVPAIHSDLRFSHEWRWPRCYSQDHYTSPFILCAQQMYYVQDSFLHKQYDLGPVSFPLSISPKNIVTMICLLLAVRSLTKIESVSCQIWASLGQLTIFPTTNLPAFSWSGAVGSAIRTFYGSDQQHPATSQAARPVNGTFPSFYGRSIPRSWSK